MTEACPFYSQPWMTILEDEAQRLLDLAGEAGRGLSFTVTTRYQSAPPTVDPAALTLTLHDGMAWASRAAAEHWDVLVQSIWYDELKAARMTGHDHAAFRAWRLRTGRLRLTGDAALIPELFNSLHDAVASRAIRCEAQRDEACMIRR